MIFQCLLRSLIKYIHSYGLSGEHYIKWHLIKGKVHIAIIDRQIEIKEK